MIESIVEKLKNKSIAILGFGREGRSTYSFIKNYLDTKYVTILDQKDISNDELLKDDKNVNTICGDKYLDNLGIYDLIIKSPGISLLNVDKKDFEERITSQLELLLEVARDNIIGVTGTKGKSTTSSLIYNVIKDQNKDVVLVGNIGVPVFDEIKNYKKDTIIVVEMSSHQLEFVDVSPHIGILLNLFQDHLDHAGSLDHYHDIKMNIFRFQKEDDYGFYCGDNEYFLKKLDNTNLKSKLYDVSFNYENVNNNTLRIKDGKIYFGNELIYTDSERKLVGDHNLNNIMFVMGVAKILNLDLEKASDTIKNFEGLKYRIEYIGEYDGIKYYNDTIATIPEATMSAVNALKDVDSLIFGGLDRKIDYKPFKEFLKNSNVSNLICMPTTGYQIGKELESDKNVYYVETLEDAYKVAKEHTEKGKSCILSPAAASYEFFNNFEEKGKCFEEIVKGINHE